MARAARIFGGGFDVDREAGNQWEYPATSTTAMPKAPRRGDMLAVANDTLARSNAFP